MRGQWWNELIPLEPLSRFGDELLEIWVICPQSGTAVLKGLRRATNEYPLLPRVLPLPLVARYESARLHLNTNVVELANGGHGELPIQYQLCFGLRKSSMFPEDADCTSYWFFILLGRLVDCDKHLNVYNSLFLFSGGAVLAREACYSSRRVCRPSAGFASGSPPTVH